jgi:hypothetical protein
MGVHVGTGTVAYRQQEFCKVFEVRARKDRRNISGNSLLFVSPAGLPRSDSDFHGVSTVRFTDTAKNCTAP